MPYSYNQLEQLWVQAGGKPTAAPTAAAVALAESSGDPGATNHNRDGSVDRGLWQINSVHGSQSTYDPMANARAAVAISNNGSTWTAWVVYQTGAYKRYLQGGTGGGAVAQPTLSLNPFKGLGGALGGSTSDAIGAVATALVKLLAPVLEIAAGGFMFYKGLTWIVTGR